MRFGGTVKQDDQRKQDPKEYPLLNSYKQGKQEGENKDEKFFPLVFPQEGWVTKLYQAGHRNHYYRGQNGIGQVMKNGGEEQKGKDNQEHADKTGHGGPGLQFIVNCRPGETSGYGIRLKKGPYKVGSPKSQQFLVGFHLIFPVLFIKRLPYGNSFGITDYRQGHSHWHEHIYMPPADLWELQRGQTLRDIANNAYPISLQPQQGNQEYPQKHYHQEGRDPVIPFFYEQYHNDAPQAYKQG